MRELPEPDGYYFREDSMYIGGGEDIKTGDYRPDTVLAIQKQAYEDGLMDATQRLAESSADVDDMFAKIHASPAFELESVRKSFGAAMLTASQKEPQ